MTARLTANSPDLLEHPRYRRFDFIDDMGACYAASDLVVCRAGAGSLMEVCAQRRPSVVVPKANLPGDHQVRNARLLERAGGCRIVYERLDPGQGERSIPFVGGDQLHTVVSDLLRDPAARQRMADAAAALATTDARRLLADCAAYLLDDGPRPEPLPAPVYPADRVMGLDSGGMERLLKRVKAGDAPPLETAEHELLLSKIDGLLASRRWVARARGCRIAGLAGYLASARVLADRAHHDVPMVRRDALIGLRGLGAGALAEAELDATLARGLDDDYFEARAAAAAAVAAMAPTLNPESRRQLTTRLTELVRDHSFEVRAAACTALARIADTPEPVVVALRRLRFDPVWKVRGALFDALAELAERGILPPAQAREELDQVLITANGYLTEYQIRHRRNAAMRRLPGQEV